MNVKKMKIIIFVILVLLSIIIFTSIFSKNNDNSKVTDNEVITNHNKYVYEFNETLELDEAKLYEPINHKEYPFPDFGYVSEFYDYTDMYYKDSDLYINYSGTYDIYSKNWKDEGNAKYIKEPTFGYLQEFVLKSRTICALYKEVKMKDVTSYINELSGLGFNEVIKDEKNKKYDYYIYSASKGEVIVTLNYEMGSLYIEVFK